MSIYVIFTCKSQPDKLDALTKILNQAKIDFPNNVKGCEAFRVFNDVNDPCAFTLVETWASETDHKKNIETMVASGVWGHTVVPAALAVRDDKARGDDAGIVAQAAPGARPAVGTAARLHF
jgi:quinol monooxygenase YgiN